MQIELMNEWHTIVNDSNGDAQQPLSSSGHKSVGALSLTSINLKMNFINYIFTEFYGNSSYVMLTRWTVDKLPTWY